MEMDKELRQIIQREKRMKEKDLEWVFEKFEERRDRLLYRRHSQRWNLKRSRRIIGRVFTLEETTANFVKNIKFIICILYNLENCLSNLNCFGSNVVTFTEEFQFSDLQKDEILHCFAYVRKLFRNLEKQRNKKLWKGNFQLHLLSKNIDAKIAKNREGDNNKNLEENLLF